MLNPCPDEDGDLDLDLLGRDLKTRLDDLGGDSGPSGRNPSY